jgi:hypothetical protein
MQLYLIQRGKFRKDGEGLTGRNGVVDLDYMGSSEFEFGAIPRSYRRIMHDFNNYVYTNSGIYTKDNNELILFSNKEQKDEILEAISSFINKPYHLKEYSELDKIPTSLPSDTGVKKLRTNFWWEISILRDWMAFLNSNRHLFEKGINYDYNNWWMTKSEDERQNEYTKSLKMY